jgi:hypothetical protein
VFEVICIVAHRRCDRDRESEAMVADRVLVSVPLRRDWKRTSPQPGRRVSGSRNGNTARAPLLQSEMFTTKGIRARSVSRLEKSWNHAEHCRTRSKPLLCIGDSQDRASTVSYSDVCVAGKKGDDRIWPTSARPLRFSRPIPVRSFFLDAASRFVLVHHRCRLAAH